MSADALHALPATSARRRRTDQVARGLLGIATLVALVPLVLVIYYLLERGLGAISWHFFSSDPTGAFLGDPGGIKSALLGTVEIVALAALIAIPIGIGVALYLVEYGKEGRFAATVRYFVESVGERFPASARVVSIGPVTSETARELGLEVAVEATEHDPDGLVDALLADAAGLQ